MKCTYWVLNGRLGGRCHPDNAEWSPKELKDSGIGLVISLESISDQQESDLKAFNIQHIDEHFADYTAPGEEEMERINRAMSDFWDTHPREKILVHCAGGNGRTGTVIAARMIWESDAHTSIEVALRRLRSVNKNAVESDAQLQFLNQWADLCNNQQRPRGN